MNTAKLPVLSNEEKTELFERIQNGDKEAREIFIGGNLRLVLSVIQRFSNRNENLDDLFQIGCIGLCKAAYSDCGGTFSTYAYRLIWNEICDALRYGVKKSKAEQLLEDINSIRAEETAAPSFETQVECIETINKVKKGAPTGIAKGIDALMMSVVVGYSCKEIGKRLHMRTNIVTAQMSKARKYLRKIPELNDLYFAGDAV